MKRVSAHDAWTTGDSVVVAATGAGSAGAWTSSAGVLVIGATGSLAATSSAGDASERDKRLKRFEARSFFWDTVLLNPCCWRGESREREYRVSSVSWNGPTH